MKRIRSSHILVKLMLVIDFFIILCFVFVYGPIDYAKVFWITTAMATGEHQYFANIFYNEETIKDVMSNNYMEEITEDTDASSITIGKQEKVNSYTSVYEKEILEHDEDALYKLIEFKYNDFDCYLVAVYDPTRLEVAYNKKINQGKIVSEIVKENKAILGINGGGYYIGSGYPQGMIVHDGKVIYSSGTEKITTGAINQDGILIVGSMNASDVKEKNIKEAVSFGPALIVNGKAAAFKGNGGHGLNPRTVLAQRKDGIMLLLVVNGYGRSLSWKGRGGVYLTDLITILQRYNAYNAVNMDGGSSTTLVIGDKLINQPCSPINKNNQHFVRSAWLLK